MAKSTRIGRPPGPYKGGYLAPHLRREHVPVRLPAWMKKLIQARAINTSRYIEKLILNDTGWKEPKK